jgi:formate dehydrogenase maturation protein FdhE
MGFCEIGAHGCEPLAQAVGYVVDEDGVRFAGCAVCIATMERAGWTKYEEEGE